jgi:hypothetical protein
MCFWLRQLRIHGGLIMAEFLLVFSSIPSWIDNTLFQKEKNVSRHRTRDTGRGYLWGCSLKPPKPRESLLHKDCVERLQRWSEEWHSDGCHTWLPLKRMWQNCARNMWRESVSLKMWRNELLTRVSDESQYGVTYPHTEPAREVTKLIREGIGQVVKIGTVDF